mgnify:CR=1 FL=1
MKHGHSPLVLRVDELECDALVRLPGPPDRLEHSDDIDTSAAPRSLANQTEQLFPAQNSFRSSKASKNRSLGFGGPQSLDAAAEREAKQPDEAAPLEQDFSNEDALEAAQPPTLPACRV